MEMGIFIAAFDEMLGQRFDPSRLDTRNRPPIASPRLEDFSDEAPTGFVVKLTAAGPKMKLDPPCPGVFVIAATVGDSRQESGQQCRVRILVMLTTFADMKFVRTNQFTELPMNLRPFPHAVERQKVLLACAAELIPGQSLAQLVIKIPQSQIAKEIRVFINELCVRLIGRFLLFDRTFAWVLDFQRGSDDQNVGQALVLVTCQDDSGNPRFDGEAA